MRHPRTVAVVFAALTLTVTGLAFGSGTANVLRVGTFNGIAGD